ncbi:MAG: hypothetical protein MI746_11345 [Pseudomonadales bacterium]|nr:hypothetical protein [Pseudomonadales bacterium]
MSTPSPQAAPESLLSAHQIAFASSLGLQCEANDSVGDTVLRIEQSLGQQSMREIARWFLLSVLQHLQNTEWTEVEESGLSIDDQYALAESFIERDEYKQSLLTVLKDPRFRFTLLGFAKGRNPERRILSMSTKAYRQARDILLEKGLVDAQQATRRGRRPARKKAAVSTAVNRRATRRGMMPDGNTLQIDVVEPVAVQPAEEDMSEEEFAELEKVLDDGKLEEGQPWTYQTNEERYSLMLGILAGACVCVLAIWLLL